jgi:hypothetical protein
MVILKRIPLPVLTVAPALEPGLVAGLRFASVKIAMTLFPFIT